MSRDYAGALQAARLDVIDAIGTRDLTLERGGYKAADQVGLGTGVIGENPHDGRLALGVLTDLQQLQRAQARCQYQQADDSGKHRAANENVSKVKHAACNASC